MKEYNGNDPINARIKINYSKNKPKISFSYPRKKSQFKGSLFMPILMVWFFLFLIFCGFFLIKGDALDQNYEKSELQKFAECSANNSYQTLTNYSNVRNNLCKPEVDLFIYWPMIVLFFGLVIPPFIIYYPFKKRWDKLYPDYQALISSKKIAKFRSGDVKDNLEKKIDYPYYIELPVFSNIICDFNATNDFSKYMKEFEIKEHKFVYYKKERIEIGKKKRKEHKVNEWLWYARWYFSDKPIKGELEVIFK